MSVQALIVFLTGQTRGMYIIFILTENFVSKEYVELKKVHNVRKWPNLCSIFGLGIL
jgi:hypothetical protein